MLPIYLNESSSADNKRKGTNSLGERIEGEVDKQSLTGLLDEK